MTGPDRFADAALSEDGLLGGRVRLLQPRSGYRAATDPVLLAAATAAREGDRVLELGCGGGAALLCLAARVPGLTLAGLELQVAYLDLAGRNAALNGVALALHLGDVADPPLPLRSESFDHVIANPPWHPAEATAAPDPGRDRAHREATPLAVWVDAALRRLRPGGRLTLIQRTERLPEILAALGRRAGAIVVKPLAAREGRPARRIVLAATKGARAPFRLLSPLVLHRGAAHLSDGDDYTGAARAILAEAAPLALGEEP